MNLVIFDLVLGGLEETKWSNPDEYITESPNTQSQDA